MELPSLICRSVHSSQYLVVPTFERVLARMDSREVHFSRVDYAYCRGTSDVRLETHPAVLACVRVAQLHSPSCQFVTCCVIAL